VLSAFFLTYKGISKNKSFDFSLGFLYILPLIIFGTALIFKQRVGHWSMYTWLYPIGTLSILRATALLNLSRHYRLLTALILCLSGFFNYYKIFDDDISGKVSQLKSSYLKKNNLIVNILIGPQHPFDKEIMQFYGKAHRGYNTIILETPVTNRELGKVFNIHKLFNAVNFIYIESDPQEKQASKKIKDLITANYKLEKRQFNRVSLGSHPFLKKEEYIVEHVYYVKSD
jgi:hypothetical protein